MILNVFRFEAEISPKNETNMFIPHQVQMKQQPIIGANTYNQVQQKLSTHAPPPPPMLAPVRGTFIPPQMQHHQTYDMIPEPSTEPTPAVLTSAPKLYTNRNPSTSVAPVIDIATISFDVSTKLKKLKSSVPPQGGGATGDKNALGPNPIAEEAIKAARASSALQNFTHERKTNEKKSKKTIRVAGGQVWEDPSLNEWPEDDFRIFCGDLGNDVNDELLTRTFNKYPSFQKAKVLRDKRTGKSKGFGFISFKEPQDFIKAMKEMDGMFKYDLYLNLFQFDSWPNTINHRPSLNSERQGRLSNHNSNSSELCSSHIPTVSNLLNKVHIYQNTFILN